MLIRSQGASHDSRDQVGEDGDSLAVPSLGTFAWGPGSLVQHYSHSRSKGGGQRGDIGYAGVNLSPHPISS